MAKSSSLRVTFKVQCIFRCAYCRCVPIGVEPGGCYLAVAAVTHGRARGLGLRAVTGGREASDERGVNDESGAVAFCVRDRAHARVEVEARGTALSWGLAVFRIGSGIWEIAR